MHVADLRARERGVSVMANRFDSAILSLWIVHDSVDDCTNVGHGCSLQLLCLGDTFKWRPSDSDSDSDVHANRYECNRWSEVKQIDQSLEISEGNFIIQFQCPSINKCPSSDVLLSMKVHTFRRFSFNGLLVKAATVLMLTNRFCSVQRFTHNFPAKMIARWQLNRWFNTHKHIWWEKNQRFRTQPKSIWQISFSQTSRMPMCFDGIVSENALRQMH